MDSTHLEQIFVQLGQKAIEWAVTSGLAVLVILILTVVALRSFRVLAKRIVKIMIEKSTIHAEKKDPEEIRKRIKTLSGILRTVGTVVIWTIAAMIIMKKLGIDIGPMIAGAGIIGLAVGFGAQNLVREIINMPEGAEELRHDETYGEKIIEPIEILGVDAFGDSAVVIKARQKTKPIQQWSVGREYLRRLNKAFDEKGIEIPFPHRSLYFGEASKPIEILLKGEGTSNA